MKLALCNEVLGGLTLEAQCELAAKLGYDGLEIAPFTLADAPETIDATEAKRIRGVVESFGLVVTGLHWLLVAPAGLSVTDPNPLVRRRTLAFVSHLVGLCASLGGTVLVHGSPKQRAISPGENHAIARSRLRDFLSEVARVAESEGVVYCLEPLSRRETELVNTIEEAAAIVNEVGSPALRTMLDCSAAGQTEALAIPELIDLWMPRGMLAHVQVNDPNRRAPGQGEMAFAPIFAALHRNGYRGVVAVEPFDYVPDGPGCAAFAAGYLRGVRESIR